MKKALFMFGVFGLIVALTAKTLLIAAMGYVIAVCWLFYVVACGWDSLNK